MSHTLKVLQGIGRAIIVSGTLIVHSVVVQSLAAQSVVTQGVAAPGATAQGLVTQHAVSLGMAKTIAEAALAECKTRGFNIAVAVVDRGGQLLVLLRHEEASPQAGEMARRKAYTARMFRVSTQEFQKRTANDAPQAGQRNLADILALSGGVPIQVGKETIGGVGSAGSTLDADDACAKAGLAKVADLLK